MAKNRKKTSPEARKSALESDYAPLYAVAGLTDALAEVLRSALAESQGKASKRLTALQSKRPELSKQARESAEELRTFVITLPDQIKNLPESTRARIAELQKQANELLAQANTAYGEFAGRGKLAVDDAVGTARELSGKAEHRAEGVIHDVAEKVDPVFEKVQETVTVARKNVTGRTATDTVTPRGAARASATHKATAKTALAKKATAKKAPAKKATDSGS
jgi:hypothetical protein